MNRLQGLSQFIVAAVIVTARAILFGGVGVAIVLLLVWVAAHTPVR